MNHSFGRRWPSSSTVVDVHHAAVQSDIAHRFRDLRRGGGSVRTPLINSQPVNPISPRAAAGAVTM